MNAQEYLTSVAVILSLMAAVALLEILIPFVARPTTRDGRRVLANLTMTGLTLLFSFVMTTSAAAAALYVPLGSPALMAALGLPALAQFVAGIVALDFAYGYAAHRALHAWPALWKYHRVHHSDAFIDVTTSYRTHPVELVWRHLWMFAAIWVLGVPAAAVVVFRVLSAANGILEHANIRIGTVFDTALSAIWVTPNMHKVHHSRDQIETDSNYGNIFAFHDRVFGTFQPTVRALSVTYGLDDVRAAEVRSVGALLAMPWRSAPARRELAILEGAS